MSVWGWLRRRQVNALMAELPEAGRVSRVSLSPGAAVVIECDQHLKKEQLDHIFKAVSGALPGVKVLVLDAGMRLRVIEP